VIQARYAQLIAKGKKPKVALVACMRKLLIHLNSLMRTRLFPSAPAAVLTP
jgi:transposase